MHKNFNILFYFDKVLLLIGSECIFDEIWIEIFDRITYFFIFSLLKDKLTWWTKIDEYYAKVTRIDIFYIKNNKPILTVPSLL